MLSIKRNRLFCAIMLLLTLNMVFLWYVFQDFDVRINRKNIKKVSLDLTIVIPTFEPFDHDLLHTVNDILLHYPEINILVLSETFPYPYPDVNSDKVKFIYKHVNPNVPKSKMDPLYYIETANVLVLPDGSRVHKNIESMVKKLYSSDPNVIFVSSIGSARCLTIDFDLKLWTLVYIQQEDPQKCDFVDNSAILFNKNILKNFTEHFATPFYESFFIQAKLHNLNIVVEREQAFRVGKILFTDSHLKWKHKINVEKQKKNLYDRFGIKRLVLANGQEKWYGCNKHTPRCFPSVIDVPYFLYQSRWTPPCCLDNLRKTARHVFASFEKLGLNYWLEGGSLLGAARLGDIIPWDYDVDIGMYMDDIEKTSFLKKIWSGQKTVDNDDFVWERATEGDFFRVQYSKINHLHVDIFPFFERNGVMTKNTWFKTHRQDMEFPARFLKPLKHLKFAGIDAMVPNNHRHFLEMKFGQGVIEKPEYPFPEKLLGISFS